MRDGMDAVESPTAREPNGTAMARRAQPLHARGAAAPFAAAVTFVFVTALPAARSTPHPAAIPTAENSCSPEQRDVLRAMQVEVTNAVPSQLPSFAEALAPGGPLAGWHLSHGYVVLDTAGAVATDNVEAAPPLPQLLLYEPSPESDADDWLDFDGPDDPYRLVGWAYIAPYTPGSQPPQRECIAPSEWFVHEAGWHLEDGGMHLTPGAMTEPPRPADLAIHMWHPRVWDLHVWRGDDGVPTVAFANPKARAGGKRLPREAFFQLVNGRKQFPSRR